MPWQIHRWPTRKVWQAAGVDPIGMHAVIWQCMWQLINPSSAVIIGAVANRVRKQAEKNLAVGVAMGVRDLILLCSLEIKLRFCLHFDDLCFCSCMHGVMDLNLFNLSTVIYWWFKCVIILVPQLAYPTLCIAQAILVVHDTWLDSTIDGIVCVIS